MRPAAPYRARGGWYEDAPESYRRVYGAGRRARHALRGMVARCGSLWKWEVVRFDLATRAVTGRRGDGRELSRSDAQDAADEAATGKKRRKAYF